MTTISVYGPQSGRIEQEEEKFYNNLTAVVQSRKGKYSVLKDVDGHVGSFSYGYDKVHCGFGWGERNRNSKRVLEFANSFDTLVDNLFFKKEAEKLFASLGIVRLWLTMSWYQRKL